MMSAVSLDQLLHDCNLRSNDLEVEITTTYFLEISHSLTRWKDVVMKLPDFEESEVHDIESDNSYEDRKRLGFLKRFKQKFSINATYKLLVEKLLEIGRAEDARKLCQVVSRYILQQHESQQNGDQQFKTEATILKKKVSSMQEKFEDLVECVQVSLQSRHVNYSTIRSSLKFIPEAEKKRLHSRPEIRSNIYEVKSLEELFFFFSDIWDYLHPGLLHFIVNRFGTQSDRDEMEKYLHVLDEFRCHVKVGIFIQVMYNVPKDYILCNKKITTIMEEGWKDKTLQDVEKYRLAMIDKMKCEEFLLKTILIHSSIAIMFHMPSWIHLNMTDLFMVFRLYGAQKVFLNDDVIYDCSSNAEASKRLQSAQIDLSSEELDQMVTKIKESEQMLASVKDEHQQKMVTANTEMEELKTMLSELHQKLSEETMLNEHLREENIHYKSELARFTPKIKLDSGYHSGVHEEKEEDLSYMELRRKSELDSLEIQKLQKYKREFMKTSEDLKMQMEVFESERKKLQDEIESKNKSLKCLQDEVMANQLSVESYKHNLEKESKVKRELGRRIMRLDEELKKEREANEELSAEMQRLAQSNRKLREEINDMAATQCYYDSR